jgi:hypothetical protein
LDLSRSIETSDRRLSRESSPGFRDQKHFDYCLQEPEYLLSCCEPAEAAVPEIDALTKKWDLPVPYRIKPSDRTT